MFLMDGWMDGWTSEERKGFLSRFSVYVRCLNGKIFSSLQKELLAKYIRIFLSHPRNTRRKSMREDDETS